VLRISRLYKILEFFPALKKFFLSNRYLVLNKWIYSSTLRLLDVGCGNHSATSVKKNFPWVKYYGIDRENYINDDADFALMEQYYEKDLEYNDLNDVPKNFFDIIICAHVIEHLHNGEVLIERLCPLLKKNGILYLEFPSERSKKFPSMPGTLNFYDDNTHVQTYSLKRLSSYIEKLGFQTIKKGTHRNLIKILLLPLNILINLYLYGKIIGDSFYDLFGFAEYGIWKKN